MGFEELGSMDTAVAVLSLGLGGVMYDFMWV